MISELIHRPSPNYDARPANMPIDCIVLHYTGMRSAEEALGRLTDPAAQVSAHYTVDEAGAIYAHVDEEQRAWHAGVSHWGGLNGVNSFSIGIEVVNPGHEFGYRDFPGPQIGALIILCTDILSRRRIPARRVLGHSDIAPLRKQDPGERFPWALLALQGIGLFPSGARRAKRATLRLGMTGAPVMRLQSKLAEYGYGIDKSGVYDASTAATITAFQRHFRPHAVSGEADGETQGLLQRLLQLAALE